MGKVVIAILCIIFLVGFAGPISNGIHNWRVDSNTQTFSVDTAAEVTSGSVVLANDLYKDLVTEVTSITSTIVETPATGVYTAATNTLTITGLTANTTRTLTVVYNSEKDDEIMQILGPFLTVLIFGGIIAAIIWYVWKGKSSR
jgi:hypothetical protein